MGVQIPPPALIGTTSTSVTVFETFNQIVYQFASTHAATSFYSQLNAKYRSCRTVTSSDGTGGSLRRTVRSQSKQRVGGHQAVQVVEAMSDSKVPGPALVTYVLWTIDGTDIYMISTTPLSIPTPKPARTTRSHRRPPSPLSRNHDHGQKPPNTALNWPRS